MVVVQSQWNPASLDGGCSVTVNFPASYAAEPAAKRDNAAEIRKAVERYFDTGYEKSRD